VQVNSDHEYDRFGPWAIEISAQDPPPPLFLPYLTNDETPLLSLKIPRKIERREASPGMNLYDYVVVVNQEEIRILKRTGDAVRLVTIFYRDIQAIVYAEDLLAGHVRLVLPEETFELPYNTVSSNLMTRMVNLIRERYADDVGWDGLGTEIDPAEEELSFYYSGLLKDIRRRSPELRVLACQAETRVGRYESRGLRRLFFGIVGKTLLESLVLSDGKELRLMNRGRIFRYRGIAVYARNTYYVPVSKIAGVDWHEDERDRAIVSLNLEVGCGRFTFAFIRDNPSITTFAQLLEQAHGNPNVSRLSLRA
jgi:hypothetical protein